MRATFECDNGMTFIFFSEWTGDERVRCIYCDKSEETHTLNFFLEVLKKEQVKREAWG